MAAGLMPSEAELFHCRVGGRPGGRLLEACCGGRVGKQAAALRRRLAGGHRQPHGRHTFDASRAHKYQDLSLTRTAVVQQAQKRTSSSERALPL